jgi:hypothetical protein
MPVARAPVSASAPKPTPTPKAATTPDAVTRWAWRPADTQGTWHNWGYSVQNDAWNGKHGPQTIYANSFHEIKVISDQPAGNTERSANPCPATL